MFGSKILDVAIGLIFVYLIVSIICTAVREGIETWLKTRAAYLEHGIRMLLDDKSGKGLTAQLFHHPLIDGLFTDDQYKRRGTDTKPAWNGRGLPSYIPSATFAKALLDVAARGPVTDGELTATHAAPITLDAIRRNVMQPDNIPSSRIRRVILHALDTAQGDLDKAQKSIEDWYNASMDRVSGWYKRSTQKILLLIGLVIAVGMNIDSMSVVDRLYTSEATRETVVAAAQRAAGNANTPKQSYSDAVKALGNLHLPIGWESAHVYFTKPQPNAIWRDFFGAWIGWILTAIAASLGAPFWFDVLNKVMVIRSTVKPHEKSPEEGSEDRQPKAGTTVYVGNSPATANNALATNTAGPAPAAALSDDADGCEVLAGAFDFTTDEQLPVAIGGVA